jgi:WD40 repeat protein
MADKSDDASESTGRDSKMDLRQATSRIKTEALRSMRMADKGGNDDNETDDADKEAVGLASTNVVPPVDISMEGEMKRHDLEPQQLAVGEEMHATPVILPAKSSYESEIEADEEDSDVDYYGEGSDSSASERIIARRRHKSKNQRKRRYTTESLTSEPTEDPVADQKTPVPEQQSQTQIQPAQEEGKHSDESGDEGKHRALSRKRIRGRRGRKTAMEEEKKEDREEESPQSQEGEDEERKDIKEANEVNQSTETAEPINESQTPPQPSPEPIEEQTLPTTPQPDHSPIEPSPYNYTDVASKPTCHQLPPSLVSLYHSFGYECQRRSNLHIMDDHTVLFIAGNMVQLLDLHTHKQTYLWSTTGRGIGSIAVHPSRRYFAVAENGESPPINIFTYPELGLHRVLQNGTERAYSHVTFNPTGDKLASVGSSPDYMLTVWDWNNEQIILRTKAFSQEVYRVSFSSENEGQLTTSGTGHIRFWKMAATFTGLKLQGDIGKFGRTELSDISGYMELPDGKVLSGTEWGNMLLWDGGLIKVEISKKKKTCHSGVIEEIFLYEGELITAGADGYIKVWDFETIDNADITEENSIFEMEPMIEIKVGNDVGVKSLVRSVNPDTPNTWLAQDSNGGIWKVDVSVSHTRKSPERLFSFHAGPINSIATSPLSHLVATVGSDSTIRLYNYVTKQPIAQEKFSSGVSSLIWAPLELDASGATVLAGFKDGVVRVISVVSSGGVMGSWLNVSVGDLKMKLLNVFKPHSSDVTALAVDPSAKLLASGSTDCSVFFMSIADNYEPIGFVKTPSPVQNIQWSPPEHGELKLLVCCHDGSVLEIPAPKKDEFDTSKTYHLDPLPSKLFKFQSVKERLLQEEEEKRKRAEEEEQKRQEEERKKLMASGSESDVSKVAGEEKDVKEEEKVDVKEEEEEEKDEEEEDEEEEEDVRVPGKLLCGFYGEKEGTFVLSMDGWDAGYLYQCSFGDISQGSNDGLTEPYRAVKLPIIDGKYEANLTACHYMSANKHLVFGTDDGCLRVHNIPDTSTLDLSNYWQFSMHNTQNGCINQISTSFDNKYIFSIGNDGNFFTYEFNMDSHEHEPTTQSKQSCNEDQEPKEIPDVEDIDNPDHYSIEEAKQKAEHDRMLRLAEEKKMTVRREVAKLRRQFQRVKLKNESLPRHLMLAKDELELDPELREEMKAQTKRRTELLRKEMEWETEKQTIALRKLEARFKDIVEFDRIVVKAMQSTAEVATFKSAYPSEDFLSILTAHQKETSRSQSVAPSDDPALPETQAATLIPSEDASHLLHPTIPGNQTQPQPKDRKKPSKAELRKQRRLVRQTQWDELLKRRPDDTYEDPVYVSAIEEAKRTMGNFKLKSSSDYIVPEDQRVNADKKRVQIVLLREQMFNRKRAFNVKLLALRDKKVKLVDQIGRDLECLRELQKELEPEKRVVLPVQPCMCPEEVPDRQLEVDPEKLRSFKREYDLKVAAGQKQQGDGGGFGGFGGFGGTQDQETTNDQDETTPNKAVSSQTKLSTTHLSTTDTSSTSIQADKEPKPDTKSTLEMQLQKAKQIRQLYRRDQLLSKVQTSMKRFNEELHALRHHKQNLEMALKQCDVRHVTQYQELLLLKEFEKREELLASRVNAKMSEKSEMQGKVAACEKRLGAKQRDIEKLVEREKQLHSTFTASLGENNKFAEFLTKVFKKKIKRTKKKEQLEEGSESESEEDSDDEDLSSSDDESDSEAGLDDSVCPVGCDETLFDQTLELREKRLDIEEELVDEKKTVETLRRECEGLKKKLKVCIRQMHLSIHYSIIVLQGCMP